MYTMLRDSNVLAAKKSLDVMVELYRKNVLLINQSYVIIFYFRLYKTSCTQCCETVMF